MWHVVRYKWVVQVYKSSLRYSVIWNNVHRRHLLPYSLWNGHARDLSLYSVYLVWLFLSFIILWLRAYLHPTPHDSLKSSERGYKILTERYTTIWEEANKNRMFLPSRGGGGNGAYGVCENKNEVSLFRRSVDIWLKQGSRSAMSWQTYAIRCFILLTSSTSEFTEYFLTDYSLSSITIFTFLLLCPSPS